MASEADTYEFNWTNLRRIALTQGLPSLGGLTLVAYAFKFAKLADMNQGCITSLFSVTGIYISIIFYLKFKEVISVSKIIGILMMVPCVVILSLDPKEVDEAEAVESDETILSV